MDKMNVQAMCSFDKPVKRIVLFVIVPGRVKMADNWNSPDEKKRETLHGASPVDGRGKW